MSVGCIPIMPLEARESGGRGTKSQAYSQSRSSTARPLSTVSLDTEFEYDSDNRDESSERSLDSVC